jgi:hypothetical protein
VTGGSGLAGAFAPGFALGAAPGPVQLPILSQTARRGLAGGLLVMLGANATTLVILLALAFGLSALDPSPTALRAMRVVGGGFLVAVAVMELRSLGRRSAATDAPARSDRWGPTVVGRLLGARQSGRVALFRDDRLGGACGRGGRRRPRGCDGDRGGDGRRRVDQRRALFGRGQWGRRLIGERGVGWIRAGLAVALLIVGAAFVVQGLTASS